MRASVSLLRRGLLVAAVAIVAGCANAPVAPSAEARAALAPSGKLHVAVYPGSPTSLVERAPLSQMRGVTVDLGRALADRLGVPMQVEVYARQQEAFAAVQRGDADFMVTNATEERRKLVDFAPPLLALELGVLVPPGSRVATVEGMDAAGVTIGVSQGSSSERVLGARFRQSKLRAFPSLDAAAGALRAREIDGFATNKGILFELGDKVPGARVLDGRWGAEHLAPAIPHGRAAGLAYLTRFTEDVKRNGELARATERAGLRGTAAP